LICYKYYLPEKIILK